MVWKWRNEELGSRLARIEHGELIGRYSFIGVTSRSFVPSPKGLKTPS